jgi:N6-adenosine-specific RNA methylase IME4
VTGLPWIKTLEPPTLDLWGELRARPSFGIGYWLRGCSEPILLGKRGNAKCPDVPYLGLLGQRMEHSRKPDSIHEIAEGLPGPYLELFARRKRLGWDVWGNEVSSAVEVSR